MIDHESRHGDRSPVRRRPDRTRDETVDRAGDVVALSVPVTFGPPTVDRSSDVRISGIEQAVLGELYHLFEIGDVRRPVQPPTWTTEEPWSKPDDPEQKWEEVPLDEDDKPSWDDRRWDPKNPDIQPNGKTITYNPETDDFTVMCGGQVIQVPWSELCPDLPASKPRPPTGEQLAPKSGPGHDWPAPRTSVDVSPTDHNVYVRQIGCMIQVNCTSSYSIETVTWVHQIKHSQSGKYVWAEAKSDVRTEHALKTSYFSCPSGGAL